MFLTAMSECVYSFVTVSSWTCSLNKSPSARKTGGVWLSVEATNLSTAANWGKPVQNFQAACCLMGMFGRGGSCVTAACSCHTLLRTAWKKMLFRKHKTDACAWKHRIQGQDLNPTLINVWRCRHIWLAASLPCWRPIRRGEGVAGSAAAAQAFWS